MSAKTAVMVFRDRARREAASVIEGSMRSIPSIVVLAMARRNGGHQFQLAGALDDDGQRRQRNEMRPAVDHVVIRREGRVPKLRGRPRVAR